MVITLIPKARSKLNDLANMKVNYDKGTLETPNRIVNKHDLKAKDKIGADVPLTRNAKSFIIEEIINPGMLNSILTINGYMATMAGNLIPTINQIRGTTPLMFFYPRLTVKSNEILSNPTQTHDYARFFTELASHLQLETIMLPVSGDVIDLVKIPRKKNLQLIPVIDLTMETSQFIKVFQQIRSIGSADIPFIAFNFVSYPYANKVYDILMDNLDRLHEGGQATMMVDIPRYLQGVEARSVSGPHYGAFVVADLVAERFLKVYGNKKSDKKGEKSVDKSKHLRVFCRNDLITTPIEPHHGTEIFDLELEKEVFSSDVRLKELFSKLVTGEADEHDWKDRRPSYVSRIHETIRSREEFVNLETAIKNNEAEDYLKEKGDMNKVVENHLGKRSR